mmetsp:Transcript_6655/g.16140  ORF Transcript_6655/g.16140 Transcript_6655/m.16140 type:complete len:134 (-) Transcript_6655:6-407(-)
MVAARVSKCIKTDERNARSQHTSQLLQKSYPHPSSMSAFVPSSAVAPFGTSSFVSTNSRVATVSVAPRSTSGPVMMTEKPKFFGAGFTEAAEMLNGRAAMLGFVAVLITEVANKTHPVIVDQVVSLLHNGRVL